MKLDLDKLEAAARGATPRDNRTDTYNGRNQVIVDYHRNRICLGVAGPDMEFIAAANPQTILALCERVRKLERCASAGEAFIEHYEKCGAIGNNDFCQYINKLKVRLADLEHSK